MAPNLQGLNIVHPVQHADAHDLLAGQGFPDLSAQLDLWTNLAFDCDEPPLNHDDRRRHNKHTVNDDDDDDDALTSHGPSTGEAAIHDGHVNVVTGTSLGSNLEHAAQPFDLNSFLVGFGVDPFSSPPLQNHNHNPITPSLAQLIALHSTPVPAPPTRQQTFAPPPAKRARTRKASVSTVAPDSPVDDDDRESTPSPGNQSVSAAEDKRRRNTAASARFRLKKKEREAALEGKAKELELRVNELERECEGLRRENGWLKGLVVGVTGAAQAPVPASVGSKRPREDVE